MVTVLPTIVEVVVTVKTTILTEDSEVATGRGTLRGTDLPIRADNDGVYRQDS